jgi:hypothetical protein
VSMSLSDPTADRLATGCGPCRTASHSATVSFGRPVRLEAQRGQDDRKARPHHVGRLPGAGFPAADCLVSHAKMRGEFALGPAKLSPGCPDSVTYGRLHDRILAVASLRPYPFVYD